MMSYYVHSSHKNASRLISPGVQFIVACRYEAGETAEQIAHWMRLPVSATADIIATYEYRAERFFKSTRGR